MARGDADYPAETPGATPEGSGRNPREEGEGASNVTARTEHSYPETRRLMEAVVERETDSCLCKLDCVNSKALHEPPWYGTVCPVVWEDGGGNPASYPIQGASRPDPHAPN